MANVLRSPHSLPLSNQSIFLAGGISNCPDWQRLATEYLMEELKDTDLTIINPRRVEDLTIIPEEQIAWEFQYLEEATRILFWFPSETLCPITLFELGKCLVKCPEKLHIGCHPLYQRKLDVITQVRLMYGWIQIHTDIFSLLNEVIVDVV